MIWSEYTWCISVVQIVHHPIDNSVFIIPLHFGWFLRDQLFAFIYRITIWYVCLSPEFGRLAVIWTALPEFAQTTEFLPVQKFVRFSPVGSRILFFQLEFFEFLRYSKFFVMLSPVWKSSIEAKIRKTTAHDSCISCNVDIITLYRY